MHSEAFKYGECDAIEAHNESCDVQGSPYDRDLEPELYQSWLIGYQNKMRELREE